MGDIEFLQRTKFDGNNMFQSISGVSKENQFENTRSHQQKDKAEQFSNTTPIGNKFNGPKRMAIADSSSTSSENGTPLDRGEVNSSLISQSKKPRSVQVHGKWIDDYHAPYSVLKYNLSREGSGNKIINTDIDFQYLFTPKMNLKPIDQRQLGRAGSRSSAVNNTNPNTIVNSGHKTDEQIGAFSGYFSVPRITINVPNRHKEDDEELGFMREVPNMCYQNHFEVEDSTFMFGGVYAKSSIDFSHLGIPADVTVDQIKVYFPYQLPPYVDTKILTNPFMISHPHFLQYNASRCSVTYLDTSEMVDFPGRFSGMVSTRISPRHFFFYGGFEIRDKSVAYVEEDNKWIIEKDIVLNEDGYIIDTAILKFNKIELNTNNLAIKVGRIGMGICSNIYEPKEPDKKPDVINEFSLSTIMLDSKNNLTSSRSIEHSEVSRVNTSTPNTLGGDKHPRDLQPTPESKRPLLHKLVTTMTSDSRYSESSACTRTATSTSTLLPRKSPVNKLLPMNSAGSIYSASTTNPGRSVPNSGNNSSSSTTSSKKSGVLARSASIFRRHRHDNNIKNPHPLKVTYNESVRTKYLNPSSATSSRATSPVRTNSGNDSNDGNVKKNKSQSQVRTSRPTTPCSPAKSLSPVRSTTSTSMPMHTSDSSKHKSFEDSTPRHSPEGYNDASQLPASVRSSPLSDIKVEVSQGNQATPMYLSTSTTAGTMSTKTSLVCQQSNLLFRSPANVSMFVFGGFVLSDESDPESRVSKFKATNELLKIDMSVTQECPYFKTLSFVKEALVSRVGDDKLSNIYVENKNKEWPLPRGYFAYTLIDNDSLLEQSCAVDVSKRGNDLGLSSSSDFERNSVKLDKRHSRNESSKIHDSITVQDFFDAKSLIVQGGCAENNQYFGDFYKFVFKTCSWEKIQTYAYDYYNIPLGGGDDEISDKLTRGSEVEHPELKEAEYRCCHHTALYYKNEERDYIFLLGGVKNNHLRLFDNEPHKSDKLDVSRLSTLQLSATNKNLLRIGVFNTQTQVWRFVRYYYDVSQALGDEDTPRPSYWTNARISHVGGTSSINGKILTLCQGLATIAPEKKIDLEHLSKVIPIEELLWGGYLQFTFPGL